MFVNRITRKFTGFLKFGDYAYVQGGPPKPGHRLLTIHTHTHTHPFNGPFSGTTQVSQYQRGKTNLDFTEARDS